MSKKSLLYLISTNTHYYLFQKFPVLWHRCVCLKLRYLICFKKYLRSERNLHILVFAQHWILGMLRCAKINAAQIQQQKDSTKKKRERTDWNIYISECISCYLVLVCHCSSVWNNLFPKWASIDLKFINGNEEYACSLYEMVPKTSSFGWKQTKSEFKKKDVF